MKRLRLCAVLALATALSGCHTMRGAPQRGGPPPPSGESPVSSASGEPQPESPLQDTSTPEEPNNDMPPSADASAAALAPCLPIDNTIPKIKPKPKPMRKRAPPPQPPAPQVAETPPDGIIDARVAPLPVSVMSILGKKVQSPKGDDLGRVVDVLADSGGRVRVAIIDFGGFLGVGDRKIAVDWPLLRFNPDRSDPSLLLTVTREKLKAAPEYKDDPRPKTLMVPEPAAAPPAPTAPTATPPAPTAPTPAPAASPAALAAPAAAVPTANSPPSAAPPANDPKK
jgi:hypothetical protein